MDIEIDGMKVNMPQAQAHCWYERAPLTNGVRGLGKMHKLPLCELPGTKEFEHIVPRAALCMNILMWTTMFIAVDGATLFALTNVRPANHHPDAYTREEKADLELLLRAVAVVLGESLSDVAERLKPGCRDPTSTDFWFFVAALKGNCHSINPQLQVITRIPRRLPEPDEITSSIGGKVGGIFSKKQTDGRTATKLQPFVEQVFNACAYNKDTFVPACNTDVFQASSATLRPHACDQILRPGSIVRMPVSPECFARELPDALWDSGKHGSITRRLGTCIMHCAMRTGESTVGGATNLLRNIYSGEPSPLRGENKARDKRIIDGFLVTLRELKIRDIIQLSEKGELVDVSFNGSDAANLWTDIAKSADGGNSVFLPALRKVYRDFGYGVDASKIEGWASVLEHWALAMRAGYELRATHNDRRLFALHARLYVFEKALIDRKLLTWYDWQMFATMPLLFFNIGSLRLIAQEGMEAFQKVNNGLQRHSNNGANVGAKPKWLRLASVPRIVEYMRERAAKMLSPSRWLWGRQLLRFLSVWHTRLELAQQLAKEGVTIDWKTQQVPRHRNSQFIHKLRVKLVAKGRLREDAQKRVHYYSKLLQEYRDYYATTKVESQKGFDLAAPTEQARALQKERRQRWKSLGKAIRAEGVRKAPKREELGPVWQTNGQLLYKWQTSFVKKSA